MEPTNVFIALLVIFFPMLITGFSISKFIIKECTWIERFGFSIAFGSCFIYFIYFILKNGISDLNFGVIFGVIGGIVLIQLINDGSGRKFFGWLFAQRRE
jgi:hypothetical protein